MANENSAPPTKSNFGSQKEPRANHSSLRLHRKTGRRTTERGCVARSIKANPSFARESPLICSYFCFKVTHDGWGRMAEALTAANISRQSFFVLPLGVRAAQSDGRNP